MSKRDTKVRQAARFDAAVAKLAEFIPYGNLLASTDLAGFMERLAEKMAELAQGYSWRSTADDPPPKDGSIIILHEGGNEYALVRWIESDELVELGGWFLAHGGPAAFIYDQDITTMRWRPFIAEVKETEEEDV